MKLFSAIAPVLIAAALTLTGCVGVTVARRPEPPSPPPHPPPPALTASDVATLGEINAAAKLNFDSSRLEALTRIARRPDLSPAAQVRIVTAAYGTLSFESSKTALLQTVIANPAFCDHARHAIVSGLERLSFDSNRQTILRELDKRITAAQQ